MQNRLLSTFNIAFGLILILVSPIVIFSYGANDPETERLCMSLFLCGTLPAALVSLKWKRLGGLFLIALGLLGTMGMIQGQMHSRLQNEPALNIAASYAWWVGIGAIPIVLGMLTFKRNSANTLER
jgi:hypothetical protein